MGNYPASNVQIASALVVCALGFVLLRLLLQAKNRSSTSPPSLPLPPGSFGLLGLGETFKYFYILATGDPRTFLQQRTAQFRSTTFKTRIFFHKTVVVQGVAANRFVAAAENKQQLLNSWPASFVTVLGEHIPATKHGAPHRRLRQIMSSCLGPVALRHLVHKVDTITKLHFETSWKGENQQVLLLSLVQQHIFRIACSLLAGIEDEVLIARIYAQFKIWLSGVVSIPVDLPGTAFRRAKKAKQVLKAEMEKLIESRQSADDAELEKGGSLLSMLLRARDESGGVLNREELQDVLLFLLFAGYDTSTATLSFALKFLEQNPACYHRLLQEHDAIALEKNIDEKLTWADIHNMKYTWAVIQETLRLRPTVFGGMKEVQIDLSFDGYRIPQGWKMYFNMSPTHDDHQYFPEPCKFDPKRFDIEKLQGNGLPAHVFIPFGIGPHSCPGGDFARMIMSIYLHHLALRRVRWTSLDCNEKVQVLPTLRLAKSYPAKIFFKETSQFSSD